jgi:hypothetical protein
MTNMNFMWCQNMILKCQDHYQQRPACQAMINFQDTFNLHFLYVNFLSLCCVYYAYKEFSGTYWSLFIYPVCPSKIFGIADMKQYHFK